MQIRNLRALASLHWRYFAPMWLLPLVLYSGVFVPPIVGIEPRQYFFFGIIPYFFVSAFIARVPYRSGVIGRGPTFVLGMLIPFGLWVTLVFGVIFLLKIFDASMRWATAN